MTRVKVVRDDELVEAILMTGTEKAAAEKAGCSVRTLYRRMDNPEFQRKLERAGSKKLGAAVNALRSNGFDVVQRLYRISVDEKVPAYVASTACARFVELMLRSTEIENLDKRIAKLEESSREEA